MDYDSKHLYNSDPKKVDETLAEKVLETTKSDQDKIEKIVREHREQEKKMARTEKQRIEWFSIKEIKQNKVFVVRGKDEIDGSKEEWLPLDFFKGIKPMADDCIDAFLDDNGNVYYEHNKTMEGYIKEVKSRLEIVNKLEAKNRFESEKALLQTKFFIMPDFHLFNIVENEEGGVTLKLDNVSDNEYHKQFMAAQKQIFCNEQILKVLKEIEKKLCKKLFVNFDDKVITDIFIDGRKSISDIKTYLKNYDKEKYIDNNQLHDLAFSFANGTRKEILEYWKIKEKR
jgi:hypothetical protein